MNKKPAIRLAFNLLLLAAISATAQTTQYWDENGTDASGHVTTNGGGTGNWNGTFWYPGTGSTDATWTAGNIASFAGTPGTVTMNANESASGLTFAVSNYTVGGSDTLTFTGTPAISLSSSGTNTISCILAGTVPVTVSGVTGSLLSLTHANTGLTGGMTINSGTTVAISAVSSAGLGTVTDNGTLDLLAAGAANYAFPLTGNGTVNLSIAYNGSSENLRFVGPVLSGFSGTINLIAGLSSGSPGAGQLIQTNVAGSGITWNVGTGATLLLNPTNDYPFAANEIILNGAGNSQPYGALRLDSCTLVGNVLLNGAGVTIGDDNSTDPSVIEGVISDGGNHHGFTSVVVSGKTLILAGADTYTGQTVIGGNGETGILELGSAENPGTSGPLGQSAYSNPGNILFNGGTLEYSPTNNYDYSGRFSANAGQAFNINLNGQSVTFASAVVSSSGTLTLSDSAGGGILTLGAANTYNGVTTVNSGTLNISGSIAGSSITIGNSGFLELSNATALPSSAILTLPSSPVASQVMLNFTGTQNISELFFGASQQAAGTWGPVGSAAVNQSAAFTGAGILNVQPPVYWDANGTDAASQNSANGGGNGNWDTGNNTWWVSGSSDTLWTNGNIATFAGTAGIVTLDGNVTANGITFNTTGYDITNTDGVSVLTLGGTPTITVPGSGTAEIDCMLGGNAGLAESGTGTLTLGGSNSFNGTVTVGTSGAIVVNGPNAFTGAMTINSSGTMTIGNSGDIGGGNYPGAIANSGAFVYGSVVNQTLSGLISGSGSVTQNGPGALTLSGYNQFTGSITINAGTLAINGTGDLGNNPTFNTGGYSGLIIDNGTFIYNSSSAETLSTGISGSGALTQSGSGLLTLTGACSYSGTTTIGPGSTLTISGSGGLGSDNYGTNIIDNGTLNYESTAGQFFNGPVSGTGVLTVSGSGTVLYMTSSNTYTGPTSIGSSTYLALYQNGDLGDDGSGTNGIYAGNITNTGNFYYNSSSSQTLSGVISGAGGVITQEGPGPLTLTGTNTFTDGIAIVNGTLTVGGSGSLNRGNYAGGVTNGTTFVYNSTVNQTMSGIIAGGGGVTQNGPGILTLTGSENYSGSTTIGPNSELIIGGAGSLGNGDYGSAITDNGLFVYDSSTAQTLAASISGSGAVALIGTNTLSLIAPNTYTGETVISNGTLSLSGSGSIADTALVSIAAGATFDVSQLSSPYDFGTNALSASGTASAAATINGASGGSITLESVPVSLTFAPQNFTGDATHQALNVAQAALTLNGNVISVKNAGASPLGAGTYSLINVPGGISGTATLGAVTGLAANTAASISVTGNSVNLVVVQSGVPTPAINSFAFSGGNLVLSGTNGPDSGTYYVLTSTNLSLPLSNWTVVSTNAFSATGTFSTTNSASVSPSYFIIEIPAH